jgi:hypothetical protein
MKSELKQLRHELDKDGILLLTDAALPSITSIIAGKPVKGSWWGHPQGNLMYNLSNEMMDEPDVLVLKLINKKVTYLQQRHWDALFAIGCAKEKWQLDKLAAAAKTLLKKVEAKGGVQAVGKFAAILEARLLIYSESIHTDSGKHVRLLSSWKNLMRSKTYTPKKLGYPSAISHFEAIQQTLSSKYNSKVRMPWD